MTLAMRNTRLSSHVAAKPMACGNTVASPERATPWRPSFHQLYSGRLGLGGGLVPAGGAAQADPWAAPVRGSWVRTGPAARGDVVLASRDSSAEIVVGAAENLNVRQAAVFLAGDIETISGYRPA